MLDRTIANGGLREESSIVMNDGRVVQRETGPIPTIVNGIQIATTYLPMLPPGTSHLDVEATIHSHPTTVLQSGGKIYPQQADTPSETDKKTFSQYNRNIIVGPLGTVNMNNVTKKLDGTLDIPERLNGIVIYDKYAKEILKLNKRVVHKILNK